MDNFSSPLMDTDGSEQFLKLYPNAVHVTDRDGRQPIHNAVMRRSLTTVKLLLHMHADPNAATNNGETPLLIACSMAQLPIIHLLVESGANIAAVDKTGCGAIHYAVSSGHVATVHYLTEVCGLSTHSRDNHLQTPLFKTCHEGHLEMLNYLLRKERSELDAEDTMGNTALHIAAEKCHSWSCWRLLEEGGLELLHRRNRDSLTPLDVARQTTTPKYRLNSQMIQMLQHYTSLGAHSGKVTGPRVTWCCHLLMPGVGYLAILALIQCFDNYQGVVTAFLILALIKIISCQSIRMLSYCRWPNPVFAGMFMAGMVFTSVCMYHQMLRYIYLAYTTLTGVCIAVNIAVVLLYYKLITSSPEVCKNSTMDKDKHQTHTILDVAEGNLSVMSFCPACEVILLTNARHCKLCDRCFYEMDHHCLIINKCIGRGNHRLFMLFLLLCFVSMIGFFVLGVWYLYCEFRVFALPLMEINLAILNYYVFLWTMLLGNVLSAGWCLGMLVSQFWMISYGFLLAFRGDTHGGSLTWKQCFDNLVAFTLGRRVKHDLCKA